MKPQKMELKIEYLPDGTHKANTEWCVWVSAIARFVDRVGLLETPKKETPEAKEDRLLARYLIEEYWDIFDEAQVLKAMARAKSKKMSFVDQLRPLIR